MLYHKLYWRGTQGVPVFLLGGRGLPGFPPLNRPWVVLSVNVKFYKLMNHSDFEHVMAFWQKESKSILWGLAQHAARWPN